MPLKLQYEKNSMRKSHRVKIPLKIYIKDKMIDVIDWSMTGIGVQGQFTKDEKDGSIEDAVLLLGMKDSTISIKVKLKLVYSKGDRRGYEFYEISDKNRKVLRRYLEFFLDGNSDSMSELISVYKEPIVENVIKEPVRLDDVEKDVLKKSFFRKSLTAFLLAGILLSILGLIFYYNFKYIYEGVGVVEGNYINIYPKKNAIVKNIYVSKNDFVKKGDILVDLDNQKVIEQIKLLQNQKISRLKLLKSNQDYQNSLSSSSVKKILNLKKEIINSAYNEYQNAKIQYQNHLITYAHMSNIKNKFLQAKADYTQYKQKSLEQKSNIKLLMKDIGTEDLDLKIENKKRELEEYRVSSCCDGKVYEVLSHNLDYVTRNSILMILWIDKKPKIIVTMNSKEATDINIGVKVDIIDSTEEHKFSGIVTNVTNRVLGSDYRIDTQSNKDLVYVEITPEDRAKILNPNSVVRVLFKRSF